MAISSQKSQVTHTGNGSTSTTYPLTDLRFDDPSWLTVEEIAEDGTITKLEELGVDYSLIGDGVTASADIITIGRAIPASSDLRVTRNTPLKQSANLTANAAIPAATLERMADWEIMALIDEKNRTEAGLKRSLRVRDGEELGELPGASERAGKYLKWDGDGHPIEITANEILADSDGAPAGVGVPSGGAVGQVLTKESGTDYATSWRDLPEGGRPWEQEGCVAAWHIDNVEVSDGKIARWNDLVGIRHLSQPDAAKQATFEQAGAVLVSGGSYEIADGLTLDNRDHTIIWIGAPSRTWGAGQLANYGYLYQTAGGISLEWVYTNTTLGSPTRYVQPLQIRQKGASSYVVIAGSSDTRIATNGAFTSTSAFAAGTSSLTRLFASSSGSGGSIAPVSAVLIFNRALSENEVHRILGFFGAEEIGGDCIVALGDSITAGLTATDYGNCWLGRTASALGASVVYSGRGGQLASVIANIPSAQIIPPVAKRVTYTVFLGTNDLAVGTGQEPTLRTNISTILSRIRTAAPHARIALFTILPRKSFFTAPQDNAGFETDRNSNNAWRRTLLGSSCDLLVDLAANSLIGPQSAADNTTYYSDKTHPNDTGHSVVAAVSIAAIDPGANAIMRIFNGSGAAVLAAGGTNQSASLRPSGTGDVILGTAGGATSFLMSQLFGNALFYIGTATGSPTATNYALLDDGAGTCLNSPAGTIRLRIGGGIHVTIAPNSMTLNAEMFLAGAEVSSAPAAPAANGWRMYAEDNGSGKTRLMVKFATGAAQQIAIEP